MTFKGKKDLQAWPLRECTGLGNEAALGAIRGLPMLHLVGSGAGSGGRIREVWQDCPLRPSSSSMALIAVM